MPKTSSHKRRVTTAYPARCFLALVGLAATASTHAADVAGSADHPDIGRFGGSEIVAYETENYGETTLATGPIKTQSDAVTTALRLEGEITRTLYRVAPGSSALEVFRNFESKIGEAGFTAIFSGGPDQFNDYHFKYNHPVEVLNEISLGSKIWYLAAKRAREGANEYLSLIVSPHSGGDGQRVRLITALTKTMENRMVDAAAMQAALNETGKVALYGIYFDTASDTMRAESKVTLDEIAKLMNAEPEIGLIVVGHTDNVGTFEYNMALSKARAKAVVDALIADYSVPSLRLRHDGVGYLAPAASNATESGRQLNRRVELVRER